MSLHSETLSWFWANQSLLLLLNAARLINVASVSGLSILDCPFIFVYNVYLYLLYNGQYTKLSTTHWPFVLCLKKSFFTVLF